MAERILILDFGSQYTQLIARRVRELQVFCELLPWNTPEVEALTETTRGIILSGGPQSVYDFGAPTLPGYVLKSGLPVLGICYGMQILAAGTGGLVERASLQEYGLAEIQVLGVNPLLTESPQTVWMSHGDQITRPPEQWQVIASSAYCPVAGIMDETHRLFGLQFHPEVSHTRNGSAILRRFLLDVCDCQQDWSAESIIQESVTRIRETVRDGLVLSAVSGGVDSSVTTALVRQAVPEQVRTIFINTGLLRLDEARQVEETFRPLLGEQLMVVDASERFFEKLAGVTDPESKRRIIGETFIREFEAAAKKIGQVDFLAQGTIYPDVVESSGSGASQAQRIKSHHNVGGLPPDLRFQLIEPLRFLFKDEVRAVGTALGLAPELVWRQPFPGPGLAVRCLGEVTPERVGILQRADAIFTQELGKADFLRLHQDDEALSGSSQAFAVLLPIRSVGVMGDQRTYGETVALRAVTTHDFMTADWARLPMELLARVSNRIVNEVPEVNRVVYDITTKPQATIEWE